MRQRPFEIDNGLVVDGDTFLKGRTLFMSNDKGVLDLATHIEDIEIIIDNLINEVVKLYNQVNEPRSPLSPIFADVKKFVDNEVRKSQGKSMVLEILQEQLVEAIGNQKYDTATSIVNLMYNYNQYLETTSLEGK